MFLLCSLAGCGQRGGVEKAAWKQFVPKWQLYNALEIYVFAFSIVAFERYYSKLQKIL